MHGVTSAPEPAPYAMLGRGKGNWSARFRSPLRSTDRHSDFSHVSPKGKYVVFWLNSQCISCKLAVRRINNSELPRHWIFHIELNLLMTGTGYYGRHIKISYVYYSDT